jgi:GNAT superfamily N-acetyltransferase
MNYRLFKIGPGEMEPVYKILKLCGQDMKLRLGLIHWYPPYPIELLRKDVEARSVYAVSEDEQIIATFTINTEPLEYYYKELWKHPEQQAMYVSHLAVLPKLQSKGIGSWCMKNIEHIAADLGCEVVRLDAYEKYGQLLQFYDKLDYERRAIVKFQNLNLVCFEKIIKGYS